MGAYLSEPVLEKHSSDQDGEYLAFGASSMQGWRVSQEVTNESVIVNISKRDCLSIIQICVTLTFTGFMDHMTLFMTRI